MDLKTDKYFVNRDPDEGSVFVRLLQHLKENLNSELLEGLPWISFIMLKPDAYLRGLVPSVLRLLQDNGVYTTRYRTKRLEARDIDELYMFVKPKYIDSWWIMDKTYRLAPCCPAIVIGDPQQYDHLSARIRNLVGPTTPTLGDDSNIRYKFRGPHRIFNMIHGTDDPAAAVREAMVFFTLDDIRAALTKAKDLQKGVKPITNVSEDVLVPQRTVDLDFFRAKYNLKAALLERWISESSILRGTLAPDEKFMSTLDRLEAIVDRLQTLLEAEDKRINTSSSAKERKSILHSVYYYQLRASSLAQDVVQQLLLSISRDSSLEASIRIKAMSHIPPIQKCIEIARCLTIDVEFKESAFDSYLAWIRFLHVDLDKFDEANLHAAWSVASTEFVDFELKFAEQP